MTRNTGTRFLGTNRKKQRVRMKAKEYMRKVMGTDKHITEEPRISRVARAIFDEGGKVQRSNWHAKHSFKYKYGSFRQEMKHRKLISIERAWAVDGGNIWLHLEYARAERDGLNYHFARHIMTKGTRAHGL